MYSNTYYEPGTNNAECAECGFVFKANQLRRRYDGLYVCEADWEPRPKQETTRKNVKGPKPIKHTLKTSKKAMEDDYDAADHTLVFHD